MGFRKASAEKRARAAVLSGDGRALLDLMHSDSMVAEELLNELGPAAGPALAEAVHVAKTDDELHAAIYKAGQSEDPAALEAVRDVLKHGSPEGRIAAIGTMLVHGTVEDTALIADCLSHPDEGVRRVAFDSLTGIEGIHGEGHLPPAVAAKLVSERKRMTDAEPLTADSAAGKLVALCDEIDVTYADPIPPDADSRRRTLRAEIALIGEALYEQGSEASMREVVTLIAASSSHANYVSREWSGIGAWLG